MFGQVVIILHFRKVQEIKITESQMEPLPNGIEDNIFNREEEHPLSQVNNLSQQPTAVEPLQQPVLNKQQPALNTQQPMAVDPPQQPALNGSQLNVGERPKTDPRKDGSQVYNSSQQPALNTQQPKVVDPRKDGSQVYNNLQQPEVVDLSQQPNFIGSQLNAGETNINSQQPEVADPSQQPEVVDLSPQPDLNTQQPDFNGSQQPDNNGSQLSAGETKKIDPLKLGERPKTDPSQQPEVADPSIIDTSKTGEPDIPEEEDDDDHPLANRKRKFELIIKS